MVKHITPAECNQTQPFLICGHQNRKTGGGPPLVLALFFSFPITFLLFILYSLLFTPGSLLFTVYSSLFMLCLLCILYVYFQQHFCLNVHVFLSLFTPLDLSLQCCPMVSFVSFFRKQTQTRNANTFCLPFVCHCVTPSFALIFLFTLVATQLLSLFLLSVTVCPFLFLALCFTMLPCFAACLLRVPCCQRNFLLPSFPSQILLTFVVVTGGNR